MNKMNVPSYNALLPKDRLIKTVQELCERVNSLEGAPASKPFNPSWNARTLSDLCSDIDKDPEVVVGDTYLGQISSSDLPPGMANGEVQIEVTQGLNGKLLLLTLTSTNLPPYHWEQSYYDGALSGWRSWSTINYVHSITQIPVGDATYDQMFNVGDVYVETVDNRTTVTVKTYTVAKKSQTYGSNTGEAILVYTDSSQVEEVSYAFMPNGWRYNETRTTILSDKP